MPEFYFIYAKSPRPKTGTPATRQPLPTLSLLFAKFGIHTFFFSNLWAYGLQSQQEYLGYLNLGLMWEKQNLGQMWETQ